MRPLTKIILATTTVVSLGLFAGREYAIKNMGTEVFNGSVDGVHVKYIEGAYHKGWDFNFTENRMVVTGKQRTVTLIDYIDEHSIYNDNFRSDVIEKVDAEIEGGELDVENPGYLKQVSQIYNLGREKLLKELKKP